MTTWTRAQFEAHYNGGNIHRTMELMTTHDRLPDDVDLYGNTPVEVVEALMHRRLVLRGY